MFGIGVPELIVIAVIALLVVGPKKLPDLAKSLGKGLTEFRKASDDVKENLNEALKVNDIKKEVEDFKNSLLFGTDEEKKTLNQSLATPSANEKKEPYKD